MKYKNKKCELDGYKFDSLKERDYYSILKLLKQRGQIQNFELQPEFLYKIIYSPRFPTRDDKIMVQHCKYIADFMVFHNDGTITVEDVKGFETAIFKRKKKIIKKLYGIDIKIIK